MPTAEEAKRSFIDKLGREGFGCKDLSNRKRQKVDVALTVPAYERIDILLVFYDDGRTVSLKCRLPIGIPDDRLPEALSAVNSANMQFPWVKFCLDSWGDIVCRMDATIVAVKNGDDAYDLMMRFAGICNDAGPAFVKAAWA